MSLKDFDLPEGVTDIVAADSGEIVFPVAPPISERMHDLDFLLGDFRVEYVNLTTEKASTGIASWNTSPLYGGRFYQMRQIIPVPGIEATWLFGWSDVDQKFVSYYFDEWGHHGETTSPGWEDGHLKFTGESAVFGQRYLFLEDLTVIDKDHYAKHGYIRQGDEWVQGDVIHCYRI